MRVCSQKKRQEAKAAKKSVLKLVAKKANGNGLPKVSSKPWGKDGKALDGVKILDFTHVQSGPTCTQLLAWFGADVIKVERPGSGDITRGQLQDVPGADSLYFTMLNHNKRSITLDTKTAKGKQVLDSLIKHCDVLVENFAPGAMARWGSQAIRGHGKAGFADLTQGGCRLQIYVRKDAVGERAFQYMP